MVCKGHEQFISLGTHNYLGDVLFGNSVISLRR